VFICAWYFDLISGTTKSFAVTGFSLGLIAIFKLYYLILFVSLNSPFEFGKGLVRCLIWFLLIENDVGWSSDFIESLWFDRLLKCVRGIDYAFIVLLNFICSCILLEY
jgi:hypothetical protein